MTETEIWVKYERNIHYIVDSISIKGGETKVQKLSRTILTAIIFITSFAFAQQGWFWQHPLPQGHDLYDVSFFNETEGWAVGAFGTILHTTDAGVTWTTQTSATLNFLFSVHFEGIDNGWIVGQGGTILHTTDGGGFVLSETGKRNGLGKGIGDFASTFDTLNIGIAEMSQAYAVVGVKVFIDTVFHTSDGDLEFTLTHDGVTDTIIYQAGGAGDNFIGTELIDASAVPISRDSAPFTGTYKPYQPLSIFSGLDPNGDWILEIYDGAAGNTGTLESWGLTIYYQDITGIESTTAEMPTGFQLYPAYPNPFKRSTKIRFTLPRSQDVRLSIYDVVGRRIAQLVDGHITAGHHEIGWNAAGYANGVYFCRLQSEEFSTTNKILLLK